jgi:hypothetical protein
MAETKTWRLIEACWQVLKEDRRLLWLPVIGVGSALAVLLACFGALLATGAGSRFHLHLACLTIYDLFQSNVGGVTVLDVVIVLVGYVGSAFCMIYFNAVLVAAAFQHLERQPRSLRAAFRLATRRAPEIFGWACFASTIGTVLQYLQGNNNIVLKILGLAFGVAWSFVTFFVVPIIVVEGLTPVQAVRRSTYLFAKTWGKQLKAEVGFRLAYLCVVLFVCVPTAVLLAALACAAR